MNQDSKKDLAKRLGEYFFQKSGEYLEKSSRGKDGKIINPFQSNLYFIVAYGFYALSDDIEIQNAFKRAFISISGEGNIPWLKEKSTPFAAFILTMLVEKYRTEELSDLGEIVRKEQLDPFYKLLLTYINIDKITVNDAFTSN